MTGTHDLVWQYGGPGSAARASGCALRAFGVRSGREIREIAALNARSKP